MCDYAMCDAAELYVDGAWTLVDASNDGNTFGNYENWTTATINGKMAELYF
jgi:hypothetical protein